MDATNPISGLEMCISIVGPVLECVTESGAGAGAGSGTDMGGSGDGDGDGDGDCDGGGGFGGGAVCVDAQWCVAVEALRPLVLVAFERVLGTASTAAAAVSRRFFISTSMSPILCVCSSTCVCRDAFSTSLRSLFSLS